jgi:hypothetical protein
VRKRRPSLEADGRQCNAIWSKNNGGGFSHRRWNNRSALWFHCGYTTCNQHRFQPDYRVGIVLKPRQCRMPKGTTLRSGDESSKKPPSVRAKVQSKDRDMGAALRTVYQKTVDESVPAEMLDLLGKLD